MRRVALIRVVIACLAAACSSDAGDLTVPAGALLSLTVSGLPAQNATVGRFDAWVRDRSGIAHSLGRLDLAQGNTFTWPSPIADPASVEVTYEPEGDVDPAPSPYRVLRGVFQGGRATLSVAGALTQGDVPLRERPGQFTMFSPSDNSVHGYPSFEESGVWLFNMAPRDTPQNDMWVRLTQLVPAWIYEGWMVRDIDTPNALWLSYGKFRPDAGGAVNSRDNTGWGPYSGVTDFLTAGEEEFPGDDWISNPLGYPLPASLSLPLNLREQNGQGASRWMHVITIEPAADSGEAVSRERPFAVRPYRDAFGNGGPGSPRTITFRVDGVPSGRLERR